VDRKRRGHVRLELCVVQRVDDPRCFQEDAGILEPRVTVRAAPSAGSRQRAQTARKPMAVPEDVDAIAGDRVEDRCVVYLGYLVDHRPDVVAGEAVRVDRQVTDRRASAFPLRPRARSDRDGSRERARSSGHARTRETSPEQR
jgi:hypothetical protein